MNGSIRVSAKTVDDAITEALIQLGVTSDRLEYEVIEKGSAGFLGIGMKQAVIEARRKPEPNTPLRRGGPRFPDRGPCRPQTARFPCTPGVFPGGTVPLSFQQKKLRPNASPSPANGPSPDRKGTQLASPLCG